MRPSACVWCFVVFAACGKDERKVADVVERPRTRIEAKDVAPEDVAPEVVTIDEVAIVEEVVAPVDVPVTVVTREACEAACKNALRVTLGELPPDGAAAMRAELEKSLGEKCPAQCVEKGSLASVTCVANAKTALELAACPR